MPIDPFQQLRKDLLAQRITFARSKQYIDIKDRLISALN